MLVDFCYGLQSIDVLKYYFVLIYVYPISGFEIGERAYHGFGGGTNDGGDDLPCHRECDLGVGIVGFIKGDEKLG